MQRVKGKLITTGGKPNTAGGFSIRTYCKKLVDESRQFAGGCTVRMLSDTTAKVVNSEGYIWDVSIVPTEGTSSCSCKRPQNTGVQCDHIMAMLFHQKKSLETYLPSHLCLERWLLQNSSPLPVIRHDQCAPIDLCVIHH